MELTRDIKAMVCMRESHRLPQDIQAAISVGIIDGYDISTCYEASDNNDLMALMLLREMIWNRKHAQMASTNGE